MLSNWLIKRHLSPLNMNLHDACEFLMLLGTAKFLLTKLCMDKIGCQKQVGITKYNSKMHSMATKPFDTWQKFYALKNRNMIISITWSNQHKQRAKSIKAKLVIFLEIIMDKKQCLLLQTELSETRPDCTRMDYYMLWSEMVLQLERKIKRTEVYLSCASFRIQPGQRTVHWNRNISQRNKVEDLLGEAWEIESGYCASVMASA